MYPFLHRCARYSFRAQLLLVAVLFGCSSTPPPTSISLGREQLQVHGCTKLSKHMSTVVYSCSTSSGPIFVSTLKDCSIDEKFTFQATTRQLLVGFVGLKVVSQEPVKLGSTPALQSVVQGALDADPIVMTTFTFRKDKCVTDLVLWRGNPNKDESESFIATFTRDSKTIADSLIAETIAVEDLGRVEE